MIYLKVCLLIFFCSISLFAYSQTTDWRTFTTKNTIEDYEKGRVMDHGERWFVYFNDEVMICNYKDTIPILWSEIIDGVEQQKIRKDDYINQYYIYAYKSDSVFKYDIQKDEVIESKITLDSLRHTIATFSAIPFLLEENKQINNFSRGDTTITSFLTLNKPDLTYPDSTYLIRIPSKKYEFPISLFPQLDNFSMKTIGYIMVYNPTVVEGNNIPRREFSTVLYPSNSIIPKEAENIYEDFKKKKE